MIAACPLMAARRARSAIPRAGLYRTQTLTIPATADTEPNVTGQHSHWVPAQGESLRAHWPQVPAVRPAATLFWDVPPFCVKIRLTDHNIETEVESQNLV